MLAAAQADTRIKAAIVTSMYDMSAAARMMQTPEQILEAKKALAAQRWAEAKNEYMPEYVPAVPETPCAEVPAGVEEPFLKNGSEWKVRPANEKKRKLKKKLNEYLKRGKAVAILLAVIIKRVNEIVRGG